MRRLEPSPVVVVSDALKESPHEGAQVLAREIALHCAQAHGAAVLGPASEPLSYAESVLRGRFFGAAAVRRLRRHRGAHCVFLPQNGFTTATAVRCAILRLALNPSRLDLVVLQHYRRPARWMRLLGSARWVAVVATAEQERVFRQAGILTSALQPRVPASKVSPRSKSAARDDLGWTDLPHYLHVGHARTGRNLAALVPLASDGVVDIVVSGYRAEEPGALPDAPRVVVHRGDRPELSTMYRAAHAYVFPTTRMSEVIGLPMSVFESLANGTPVAARRSEALERWSHLEGLHLTDTDDELIRVAEHLASTDGTDAPPLARQAECLGDLTPCTGR